MRARSPSHFAALLGIALATSLLGAAPLSALDDLDGDGVADAVDNCVETPNGPLLNWTSCPSQFDYDGDGYGNACDGDYNQDGIINHQDWSVVAILYGSDAYPESDLDCNGRIDMNDGNLLLLRYLLAPGPAGGL